MGTLLLVTFCFFVYFLPTIVGWNKLNIGAIFVLNFFLGWTLVGWVVALVWASTHDSKQSQPTTTTNYYPADKINRLERLKSLHDSGVLTEDEYRDEKNKILLS